MSSKKARRKKEREQKSDSQREARRLSSVTLFLLGIGLAVTLAVAGSLLLADRSDRGEPPFPGAVWSTAHDHWH